MSGPPAQVRTRHHLDVVTRSNPRGGLQLLTGKKCPNAGNDVNNMRTCVSYITSRPQSGRSWNSAFTLRARQPSPALRGSGEPAIRHHGPYHALVPPWLTESERPLRSRRDLDDSYGQQVDSDGCLVRRVGSYVLSERRGVLGRVEGERTTLSPSSRSSVHVPATKPGDELTPGTIICLSPSRCRTRGRDPCERSPELHVSVMPRTHRARFA